MHAGPHLDTKYRLIAAPPGSERSPCRTRSRDCHAPWSGVRRLRRLVSAEKIGHARRTFEQQQRALDVEPAAEAGQGAVRADDAVAGNDDRQRVRAVSKPHGACTTGVAETARQFGIGNGLTIRDGPQRLPDRQLERSACRGEREPEGAPRTGKVLAQLREHAREWRNVLAPLRYRSHGMRAGLEMHPPEALGVPG